MNCSLFPFLILLFFSCGPSTPESSQADATNAVTTFILVRHAEKGTGDDPELTSEGRDRAERLRNRLADDDVSQVYSTDTQRTRQTAAPTAEEHGLEVQLYSPDALADFARNLKQEYVGETVLIVGHSNTTPVLANLLAGSEEFDTIDDSDYGNLLIITVPRTGKASAQNLRY